MKNPKPLTTPLSRLRAFMPSRFHVFAPSCLRAFALFCFLPLCAFAQFSGGSGTETSPYMITSAEQLAQLATYVNAGNTDYNDKYYILNNDISLSAYQSGTGWVPIGYDNEFRGNFDGNNKKITELYIHNPNLECTGLFGYSYGATLKNLTVENVYINGGSNVDLFTGNSAVGALVGYAYNCKITNCNSSGEICGKESVGGIVGFFTGQISDCHSACKITGIEDNWISVGGVVGKLYYNAYANRCYSTGKINVSGGSHQYIGSVIGEAVDHTVLIENCTP